MQSAAKLAIDNRALILAVVRQRAIRPAELFSALPPRLAVRRYTPRRRLHKRFSRGVELSLWICSFQDTTFADSP